MTTKATILVLAMASAVSAQDQAPSAGKKPEQAKADVVVVATANNAFACDLYARLREEEGNLFFSPHNICVALAMTYAGAGGKTAEQIAATLHVNLPAERAHAAFGRLVKELNDAPKERGRPAYQLVVSNALWLQKGYPFEQEFASLVEASYGAELKVGDFSAPESVRKAINAWAEKATDGKSREIIGPEALSDSRTRLVLTSTIYFKSRWANTFSKDATKLGAFHLANGKTVEVPLMTREMPTLSLETDEFQLADLPYEWGGLNMTVLLPRKTDGLPALEKKLTAKALGEWTEKATLAEVNLTLPRFKFPGQFLLKDVLTGLGMPDAFDEEKADFTGMTTREKLWLDDLLHQTSVSVDEEGTEAEARTIARFFGAVLPKVTFRADRAFLFVIRHRATGAVLFLGRVTNPGA